MLCYHSNSEMTGLTAAFLPHRETSPFLACGNTPLLPSCHPYRKSHSLVSSPHDQSNPLREFTQRKLTADSPLDEVCRQRRLRVGSATSASTVATTSPHSEPLDDREVFPDGGSQDMQQSRVGIHDFPTHVVEEALVLLASEPTLKARYSTAEIVGLFHLLLSIISLYHDQIMPFQRRVRRRLREIASPLSLTNEFLHLASSATNLIQLDAFSTAETKMLLAIPPKWFQGWVCVRSRASPFPPHVWTDFKDFLSQLPTTSIAGMHSGGRASEEGQQPFAIKGGRYVFAKIIKNFGPPSLSKYSLGHLCHLVQLGLVHGIVHFSGEYLQPSSTCSLQSEAIADSDQTSKEVSEDSPSRIQLPVSKSLNADSTLTPVETLSDLLALITAILIKQPHRMILLSQFKFLCSIFHCSISPSTYGYAKLSDLIVEKCESVCKLYRYGGRQIRMFMVGHEPTDDPKAVLLKPAKATEKVGEAGKCLDHSCCATAVRTAGGEMNQPTAATLVSAADYFDSAAETSYRHANLSYDFLKWSQDSDGRDKVEIAGKYFDEFIKSRLDVLEDLTPRDMLVLLQIQKEKQNLALNLLEALREVQIVTKDDPNDEIVPLILSSSSGLFMQSFMNGSRSVDIAANIIDVCTSLEEERNECSDSWSLPCLWEKTEDPHFAALKAAGRRKKSHTARLASVFRI